jgi:hypothetical protein
MCQEEFEGLGGRKTHKWRSGELEKTRDVGVLTAYKGDRWSLM